MDKRSKITSYKNPLTYFQTEKRDWPMVNILLFLVGCFILLFLLDLNYGQIIVGLSAISIPTALVYRVGQPAFDAMFKDYFLDLPRDSLIFLAKLQGIFIVFGLLGIFWEKVISKEQMFDE